MIFGETVVVERETETGRDAGNNPITEWVPETVTNVLVAPGPRSDVVGQIRPEGVEIRWNLHFPKGYPATLRGARISVRGGSPLMVVGDPQHYAEELTPGDWSMPVEIGRVDG